METTLITRSARFCLNQLFQPNIREIDSQLNLKSIFSTNRIQKYKVDW